MFARSAPPQISLPAFQPNGQPLGQTFGRPIPVDMEAFFEFSFWIAEELLDLEASFADDAPFSNAGMASHSNPIKAK